MRPLARLAHGRKLTLGGTGGTFTEPNFWVWDNMPAGDSIECSYGGYVSGAYKGNGIVSTCINVRGFIFSEARFQFQRITNGRPADLFGSPDLAILERPWPNGTTGELLMRMEQDGSLAGNFYATVVDDQYGRRLRRLRPDCVTIVTGSRSGDPLALDARVVGYMYDTTNAVDGWLGYDWKRTDPVLLTPDKVAHWSPIPDPDAQWRGMSWLTPVLKEIEADNAATKHKAKFFENGTVGSIAITYDASVSQEAVARFAEMFKQAHAGTDNAYKTYHLGGGADAKTLGSDLKQLDFKVTQGAGETRIAAASGLGAVIAQLSEGLQGSSLNAGNFNAARRRVADGLMRPLWRGAASSLETLAPPPPGGPARLWYDVRDVPFLKEDQKDEAAIQATQAQTIRQLVDAGFDPDTVITAVTSGDLHSLVGAHGGLFSVQLQPAGGGQGNSRELSLVEMVQKVYLGVGTVLTADEARGLLNSAGANLPIPAPALNG